MQDFLYLFIGGRDIEQTAEERELYVKDWIDWMDDLRTAGVWVGGHPLEDGGKTITGTDKRVTDGPFAETKELVGGFIQVRVEDIDSAVAHAKNCPIYPNGGRVEIRQIHEIPVTAQQT